jgi:hypothetical protein
LGGYHDAPVPVFDVPVLTPHFVILLMGEATGLAHEGNDISVHRAQLMN